MAVGGSLLGDRNDENRQHNIPCLSVVSCPNLVLSGSADGTLVASGQSVLLPTSSGASGHERRPLE